MISHREPLPAMRMAIELFTALKIFISQSQRIGQLAIHVVMSFLMSLLHNLRTSVQLQSSVPALEDPERRCFSRFALGILACKPQLKIFPSHASTPGGPTGLPTLSKQMLHSSCDTGLSPMVSFSHRGSVPGTASRLHKANAVGIRLQVGP